MFLVSIVFGPCVALIAADSPIPSDPVFTGLLVDGKTLSGRIVAFGAGEIELYGGDGSELRVKLGDLVKLVRESKAVPAGTEGSHVIFPGGDRLMRVVVGAAGETALEVQSYTLGKLSLPLDSILGLILAPPGEADAFDRLWESVRIEPRKSEVVWMANNDRLAGGFLRMDDRMVKFQVQGKPVEIDRTGVVAIGFDPAIISYPRPRSDFLELTLADGTRLGVSETRLEKGHVQATTRFGQSIRFPISELVRVDPRTARIDYLSEREVVGQQYVSYVGPSRPFQADRTIEGHRFQLGGQVFDRGLGTQSRTLLAYRLAPEDRRFQATVGVDERAGALGSVVFRVLVDGQPRFTSPTLTARDAPRDVDIEVAGGKLLILITEFGDRGDIRDLADWVEARIVR